MAGGAEVRGTSRSSLFISRAFQRRGWPGGTVADSSLERRGVHPGRIVTGLAPQSEVARRRVPTERVEVAGGDEDIAGRILRPLASRDDITVEHRAGKIRVERASPDSRVVADHAVGIVTENVPAEDEAAHLAAVRAAVDRDDSAAV